jgi:UDP-N-acetylglucosamine 4,6-dehydratase
MTCYLITGAAGSLGSNLITRLSKTKGNRIRAFDIDEYGLSKLPVSCRRIHGSITDKDKLTRAMQGCEVVIHCAAIKNLDISEYNIDSLIETNINGTMNVVNAVHDCKVATAIFISSDKAVTRRSIYGMTKAIGEQIWKQGQMMTNGTVFLTLRSGNFCYSRGSVFDVWEQQHLHEKPITLTSQLMWRYFIPMDKVSEIIVSMINKARTKELKDGAVVVPKMTERNIKELANKFYPESQVKITGIRKGESLHEQLLEENEKVIMETPEYYIVGERQ